MYGIMDVRKVGAVMADKKPLGREPVEQANWLKQKTPAREAELARLKKARDKAIKKAMKND